MISPKVVGFCALSGAFLLALAVGGAAPTPPAAVTAAVPAVGTENGERTIEDGGTGTFKAIMVGDSSIATHTVFRPKDLSAFGDKVKLPILAWGNGGCANSPSGHVNYLSEIASHGFLIVAIGPMQAGGGARGGGRGAPASAPAALPPRGGAMGPSLEDDLFFVGAPGGAMAGGMPGGMGGGMGGGMPGGMGGGMGGAPRGGGAPGGGGAGGSSQSSGLLDAIKWAIAQNENKDSRYFGKIDVSKVGVFGHSCGGLQALEVSTDPRVSTTIVVDSGILNSGGGGGAAPGAGRAAPASAPARAGALGPTIDGDQLLFVGAPGGGAGGAPGGGARAGGMGGGMGGALRGGGAGGGGGGGMAGMPALTKDHLAKLTKPVFYLLGGSQDMAYENGMDDFKRLEKIPVFVANRDVGHGGTFTAVHGGDWAMASVNWFKWQLKDDKEAGKLFTGDPCGLSKISGWKVEKKNIP